MLIGLISGHGAGDPGASGCGYDEADLTVEVVKRLDEVLNAHGIETKVYPYENNAYYDCRNGGIEMDFSDCTYVLEVHFNACVDDQEGDGHITGTEIWVTPREEHVSVEETILSNMENIGFTNRGVKVNDFLVINTVKSQGVSSALIETCFVDDADDIGLFKDNEDSVIEAIAKGIVEGFGEEYGTDENTNSEGEGDEPETSDNTNHMDYNNEEFIEMVAAAVKKNIGNYGISVVSAIVAQACNESAYGKSEKAKYYNLFGLKYREGRVSVNTGYFNDSSTEQNPDGSYEPCNTDWYSFNSIENAVIGYLQFINIDNYANLKGVTDPYEYLRLIREDGYATSLEYVDRVYSVVKSQNLTRFDSDKYNPDVEPTKDIDNDTEDNEEEHNYAHTIGDVVNINGVHYTSMAEECMTPGYSEGTITYIAYGARNPYLVDNGNLGWVNDDDVVSCSEHSSKDSRLTPQQIAYEICFGDNRWGDYPERRAKLEEEGYSYSEIQDYVNVYMGQ